MATSKASTVNVISAVGEGCCNSVISARAVFVFDAGESGRNPEIPFTR